MAYDASLTKALVSMWRASTHPAGTVGELRNVTLTTTRVPQSEISGTGGVSLPYCRLLVQFVRHGFSSGNYRLGVYRAVFEIYVGQDKTLLDAIAHAITAVFDRNLGIPLVDTFAVVNVQSFREEADIDQRDWYGEDVNTQNQTLAVTLSEQINPVAITPVT